jgi:hypothetical protein
MCSGNVKIFILFALAAMLGFNAMAQEKDKKTKPFPTLAVANGRMNVFYAGIPNPVRIAASVNPKKLRIDWGGVTATYMGAGRYDVSVSSSLVGREITITVYTETKKGKIQNLEKIIFRGKAVYEPNVYVGVDIWAGKQYKDTILANPFISAIMGSDFNYHLIWQVISYKVTFVINRIAEEPIIVCGAPFSEEVINKIKNAPHGTIVEFSKIRIKSLAGCGNIQNPRVIRIIETEDGDEKFDRNFDDGDSKSFDYEDFEDEDFYYKDCDD